MTTYLKSADPSITRCHIPYGTDRPGQSLCGITAGLTETRTATDGGVCSECCRRRYAAETERVDRERRQMMRSEL